MLYYNMKQNNEIRKFEVNSIYVVKSTLVKGKVYTYKVISRSESQIVFRSLDTGHSFTCDIRHTVCDGNEYADIESKGILISVSDKKGK